MVEEEVRNKDNLRDYPLSPTSILRKLAHPTPLVSISHCSPSHSTPSSKHIFHFSKAQLFHILHRSLICFPGMHFIPFCDCKTIQLSRSISSSLGYSFLHSPDGGILSHSFMFLILPLCPLFMVCYGL